MQAKGWLYGYGLTAVLHGLAILAGWETIRFITKPLLMIILLVWFLFTANKGAKVRHWISTAIFFSWLGDIFLMNEGDQYFMAGLGSFLLAHLCYIFFFTFIRTGQSKMPAWNIYILVALSLYVGIFYFFLAPHLNNTLKPPVFIYAFVIAAMFASAYHAFSIRKSGSGLLCITGAALFILSDSLLAINAFIIPFTGASLAVMTTYILAQLTIVKGAQLCTEQAINERMALKSKL
ncbi:lysoplasmalogenase [Flavihumibacter profundi]|uniref:lysoplasmalogenase n=1 Tax=Flavihumibacter profundi TaxID=2716883 RepID=UPI001CC3BA71|nr:lysoplasmalogenase [Flavihumibacter profundi]MBZ5857942.1 lysoplasmalogenase [Flavihumibacter profundi]